MAARFSAVRGSSSALVLMVFGGCATQPRESAIEQATATGSATSGPASGAAPGPSSEAPRSPSVRIVNVAPGRFLIEADAPARIATAATLEHRSGGGQWLPTPFSLRDTCAPKPTASDACRELNPGMAFTPLSWNGTPCGPCCSDADNATIDPGTYRLVLGTCDGQPQTWTASPFEVPAATDVLERWRATSNVERVLVFQVDPKSRHDGPSDDRHIAGDVIIAGSEVPMSPALVAALANWLRDPAGFSDRVLRRCIRGQTFGFRFERNVPGIGHERSELTVDIGCRVLKLVNQEGNLWQRSFTYFDDSRAALLAILREALPPEALRNPSDR